MLAQFLENVSDEKRDCVFLQQDGSIAQSKPPEFAYINTCIKMADGSLCCGERLTQVEENSELNQISSCKSCMEYKCILEELTQELQSAKKIIQLLKEDVNMNRDHSLSATPRFPCENNTSSVSNKESSWKKVLHRSSNRINPRNSPCNQWPIPMITTSNHFDILHNLKFDQQLSDNKSILPSKTFNNNAKLHLWKRTSKGFQVKLQKKIVMIGDSHARGGLTSELKNHLGHEYSISSTFMPGAGLQSITNLAKSEITTLTNSDTVIVCGGSNDVNRDRSHIGLNFLKNFVNLTTNTKVLILTLPPRYDLIHDSCVSREIHSFNRQLHKIMKNKEMVKVLDCDITREGFTCHGQHLNLIGKSKMAQLFVQYLTKPSTNSNMDSIPMKWKTSTSDFIPIGCEVPDTNNDTSDLDNDVNAENQPTTNNQNIRMSNRRRKLLSARSHDFLWE